MRVKIDGSFVKDLANSPADQVLVKALCSVAREFGKKITAEFVENEEVLILLEKMEVDFAQGYYIGKPCAGGEIFNHLKLNCAVNKLEHSYSGKEVSRSD